MAHHVNLADLWHSFQIIFAAKVLRQEIFERRFFNIERKLQDSRASPCNRRRAHTAR